MTYKELKERLEYLRQELIWRGVRIHNLTYWPGDHTQRIDALEAEQDVIRSEIKRLESELAKIANKAFEDGFERGD